MLLMSGLLYAINWFVIPAIVDGFPDNLKIALKYFYVPLWVLLPVTGWVAESWLGRYRAIVVGLVLSFMAILTLQVAFVLLQFHWTPVPAFVLVVMGISTGTIGVGSFYTIMLPFALDQMIGASAEQLRAAVHVLQHGAAQLKPNSTTAVVLLGLQYWSTIGRFARVYPDPKQATIPGHPSNDLPHFSHSVFLSCSDNGLPVPQVARH